MDSFTTTRAGKRITLYLDGDAAYAKDATQLKFNFEKLKEAIRITCLIY
jgi:hypothetical protein